MLKLLVGALLFVCCGYVGYGISAHYRKRCNLLVSALGYLDHLENGVSYLQNTLGELTLSYCQGKKDEFCKILKKYSGLLEGGYVMKEDCIAAAKSRYLTAYEQSLVAEMLFSLGKSDLDTQLSDIKKYRAAFSPIEDAAKSNQKKYGTLAFKLGILSGLAAMLVVA